MVEAEARLGLERPDTLAGLAIEQVEPRPELRLPAVVLDVGAAAERESQRVDHVGELGQDEPARRQPERVHVGRLADRLRGDHLRLRPVGAHEEEAVAVARPELGGVVQHPLRLAVHVGMGGRQDARRLVGDPGRLERPAVELDRDRRLGHRDEPLAELRQVDVRVVAQLRREHRRHPLEERPAGIGRELRVADLSAFLGRTVGVACRKRFA